MVLSRGLGSPGLRTNGETQVNFVQGKGDSLKEKKNGLTCIHFKQYKNLHLQSI